MPHRRQQTTPAVLNRKKARQNRNASVHNSSASAPFTPSSSAPHHPPGPVASHDDGIKNKNVMLPPPNIEEVLDRDDFVITNPSRYEFRFSSAGPPRAEIHLVTSAHMVLPDHKLATKLPEDVIPDLVQARVDAMGKENEQIRNSAIAKEVNEKNKGNK